MCFLGDRYHTPPRLGMPDVQLELPKDRPLKSVIERLRVISPQGNVITTVLAFHTSDPNTNCFSFLSQFTLKDPCLAF